MGFDDEGYDCDDRHAVGDDRRIGDGDAELIVAVDSEHSVYVFTIGCDYTVKDMMELVEGVASGDGDFTVQLRW